MKNTTHHTERTMKKIMLFATLIGLAACSNEVAAQVVNKTTSSTNPVKLTYEKDEFTGEEYLLALTGLLVSDDGKKGFVLRPSFGKENGKWKYRWIFGVSTIGNCFENDKVYIIFEDGSKFDMTSWRDFNCEGDLTFDLFGKFRDDLSKPMKGIKFVNGRDYSSFHKMFTNINDKNYFINAFKALDAYNSTH